jgi:hypothetical protein
MKLLEYINFTGIILSIFGYIIGLKFPDIDHKIKFLSHRSIITHSPFIAIFFYFLYIKSGSSDFNYFITSFFIAESIHMIYDFFPKGWIGGALIKAPFINSIGVLSSKIFIFISLVILMGLSFYSFEGSIQYRMYFIESVIFMILLTKKEEKFFRPILLFIILYSIYGYIFYPVLTKSYFQIIYNMGINLLNFK